jgi:hypothetical protein
MKIEFNAFDEDAGASGHVPIPAVKALPKWYSNIPRFTDNGKKFKFFANRRMNITIKWCNPFFDSLTAGYILTLENDLFVAIENGQHVFTWKMGGDEFISIHDKQQVSEKMVPPGFDPQPFKFKNTWSIKTPNGYSALFMHPLNRNDLPFQCFSGFVDTDGYNIPVHFPFVIRADFEGIIPAGTPIVQVIPIKRESWTQEIGKYDPSYVKEKKAKFMSTIYRAYKNLFWKRKDYR